MLLWGHTQYRNKRRAVQPLSTQQTLANCNSLLILLGVLQQHRGLSCTWLAGGQQDRDFRARLDVCGRRVEEVLVQMCDVIRIENEQYTPCVTANDWALFKHHWKDVREILPTLSVEQTIARHSQLLRKILGWLAAIGESRIEPLAIQHQFRVGTSVGAARNFVDRLPQLTECLGQIRAIGCSVAAQERCSQVARVRLLFLVARAETLLNQAAAVHGNASVALNTQKAIKEMAATVRTRMLFSGGVVVKAEEFFVISSKAIDLVFEMDSHISG